MTNKKVYRWNSTFKDNANMWEYSIEKSFEKQHSYITLDISRKTGKVMLPELIVDEYIPKPCHYGYGYDPMWDTETVDNTHYRWYHSTTRSIKKYTFNSNVVVTIDGNKLTKENIDKHYQERCFISEIETLVNQKYI